LVLTNGGTRTMLNNFKQDLPASIIVFFVALPLCLGIALASGAPLFSGVIAGIVGGIVVGYASGSPLGVSGPAAGLAVVVFAALQTLGSWEAFLVAVMIAGIVQLILGYAKAGFIAYFFPSSVIKGMLAGIGLIIIIKQIPHAVGFDTSFEGDETLPSVINDNVLEIMLSVYEKLTPGALLISVISMAILILWDVYLTKKSKFFQILQGPIVVVGLGMLFFQLFKTNALPFALDTEQVVSLPVTATIGQFFENFYFPDFSVLNNPDVYKIGIVMAIIASVETLLCVEATDKLDPYKRVTPTNRELKAQGLGNLISGFIGGLPITQVVVRSSANITFGAKSKLSAILHGFFLLISVITIAKYLNMIPLASLAAILIMVGYKLAKVELFVKSFKQGYEQFLPFIVTVIAILLSDLLTGIMIGVVISLAFTLYHSYKNSHFMSEKLSEERGNKLVHHIKLAQQVSFFNKASIITLLEKMPENCKVVIDGSESTFIDRDVLEVISDFKLHAGFKKIEVETVGI
jgi:MFS superfamily sulfate permease-like transporter